MVDKEAIVKADLNDQVILVDENDNQVGVAEKLKAHEEGWLHRAFSVFLFRENESGDIEVLLQQRQLHKYHCGGLWSNTCCSHPRSGETVLEAGQRRVQEELGITLTTPLQAIDAFTYRVGFKNGLTEHEYDHVLVARHQAKVDFAALNPLEVADCRWVDVEQVYELLSTGPDTLTPWFAQAWACIEAQWEQIETTFFPVEEYA